MSAAIETSFVTIPLTSGKNNENVTKLKPGWKENVEPFQKDAQFWYGTW